MKRQIKIILFIILCTSILGVYAYTNSQKKLTKKEIAEKVEAGEEVVQDGVVYFAINGYKFEVATKYMQRIMRLKSTKKINSAEMWALLPDFEAYDKNQNHYEFYEERGHGSRVQISFSEGKYTKEGMIEFLKNSEAGLYQKYFNNTLKKDNGIKDLERFPINYTGRKEDYFFNRTQENYPDTYLICDIIEGAPSPSCWMRWSINQNTESVKALTIFHRKYLPNWKEIKEKTELLIKNKL